MPTYIFENIKTGDVWEEFCSMSHREEILKNPDITQIPCAPAIVSGVGGIKVDSGFKDVLQRLSDANPHSPMAQTHGDKGVTASKTRNAVNKAKSKMGNLI
jgi:hypothetical protein